MAEPIRVLLADDHPCIRLGLRTALAAEPDLAVVGEAADGAAVREASAALDPDVLLLDLRMPGPPVTETAAWLRAHHPRTRVVALTAHDDPAWVHALVALGVAGYVLKDDALEVVAGAIRAVARGGSWFSPPILALLARAEDAARRAAPELSARDRQLLALLARGDDTRTIAAALNLGPQTVSNYLSALYARLGVRGGKAAVARARELGLA